MKREIQQRGMTLKSAVRRVCKPILEKHPNYRIFLEWNEIVGHEISALCSPEKITNDGETLVLNTDKGAILEIQYCVNKILDKLHVYLGNNSINRIIINQKRSIIKKREK